MALINFNSLHKILYNIIKVSGACFDWFPVSCEPPEKKRKEKRKKDS